MTGQNLNEQIKTETLNYTVYITKRFKTTKQVEDKQVETIDSVEIYKQQFNDLPVEKVALYLNLGIKQSGKTRSENPESSKTDKPPEK